MGGTNNRIRLNTIKIFMLLVVIVGIFFIVNTRCFAEETGYSFVETKYDIDNIKTETFNFDNFLIELLGFNFIYVPYIVILLYILIQLILIKKYKSEKLTSNFILCLKINLIVILFICLINTIISNYVIDISRAVEYITSTMYIKNSFLLFKIINIVVNTIILIVGLIFSKKLLRNNTEENRKTQNKKMLIMAIVIIVILSIIYIFERTGYSMHVVERDWGFGETIDSRQYDLKVHKGKNIGNTSFLVKEIDDEGVLIEYERGYYEILDDNNPTPTSLYDRVEYKTEIVQQKMKWNINYSYEPAKYPLLSVDGGTDYYVRFEK